MRKQNSINLFLILLANKITFNRLIDKQMTLVIRDIDNSRDELN